jgi:hypothetical protein
MVYSSPNIAEIDLLLIFEGGYVCVELKRKKTSKALKDPLKYFVNGLAQQPVFYVYDEGMSPSEERIPNPFLLSQENSDFLNELKGESREKIRSYMALVIRERKKLFSLDNFLRLLLVYGSPSVCKGIFNSTFFRKLSKEFQLVKTRYSQICKVKLLNHVDDISPSAQTGSESSTTKHINRIVMVIASLNNKFLWQKVAEAISSYAKNLSAKEVILSCTGRSKPDAEEVQKRLEHNIQVQAKIEIVEGEQSENIERAWVNSISKLCECPCVILFVGEVPKGVLVEIAKMLQSKRPKPNLAVLTWRPQLDSIDKLMQGLELGDVTETERVELDVVEL